MKSFLSLGLSIALTAAILGADAFADTLGNRAGAVVQDSLLYAAVRGHLVDVDLDSATAIHVDVDRGVVTLSGRAHSAAERAQYVSAARSVSGVTAVRDDIAIDPRLRGPSEATRDDALAARVYAALIAQSGVNAFRVDARVRDGVVTLNGSVPNRAIEQTVVATAAGVQGVLRVVNRLALSR